MLFNKFEAIKHNKILRVFQQRITRENIRKFAAS